MLGIESHVDSLVRMECTCVDTLFSLGPLHFLVEALETSVACKNTRMICFALRVIKYPYEEGPPWPTVSECCSSYN